MRGSFKKIQKKIDWRKNMFALTLTHVNDRKILKLSNSKDEILAEGNKVFKTLSYSDGILSCIEADFDNDNNIINNRYKLYNSWI